MSLLAGMNYYHLNGIIHGDLKPDNIIIKSNYSVEIIDFKSAICTSDDKSKIGPGSFLYRAPEVYSHQNFDKSADIYSLGLIVFFMDNGIDPTEYYKSYQNPADALEEYFGIAHSPQIRWLCGVLSAPDKDYRFPLEHILLYLHFTDCNITTVANRLNVYNYDVDYIYGHYLNGCQYANPIFVDGFFQAVAVDCGPYYYYKTMKLQLCLNGFSLIDDSMSEYLLDLYSYQENIPVNYIEYISTHIAIDSNDIIKNSISNASWSMTAYAQLINFVSSNVEHSNFYDHDVFLHTSLLYNTISPHRNVYLQIHLALNDREDNKNFKKIDQSIDPYDVAHRILTPHHTIFSMKRLLFKYHHLIDIVSSEDKASLHADNFHALNYYDQGMRYFSFLYPDTLSYEATDPYQVLQIIGSHIPYTLWNFADLCILIEIIYWNYFMDLIKKDFEVKHIELDIKKAVSIFKQLLNKKYDDALIYNAYLIVANFFKKYNYLYPGWVILIARYFPPKTSVKCELFMTKYKDIVDKMFCALM